jgi:hypothetical protein
MRAFSSNPGPCVRECKVDSSRPEQVTLQDRKISKLNSAIVIEIRQGPPRAVHRHAGGCLVAYVHDVGNSVVVNVSVAHVQRFIVIEIRPIALGGT